jgi:guanine deaminase
MNKAPNDPQEQARILSEALPHMQRYDEEIVVVKYGGHAMGDEQAARNFARDIVLLEQAAINPVVVHGGGPAVEVIDAHDHLVLPGFVNAHYHSHDVLAKGTLEEVPLESWRLYALPPQYPPRSVEEIYARTLLGALECLRSGMTTIQDMLTLYPYEDRHMDAVMAAYEKVGIRVVFALQYADRKGIETIPFWKDTFPAELHPLLSTATP